MCLCHHSTYNVFVRASYNTSPQEIIERLSAMGLWSSHGHSMALATKHPAMYFKMDCLHCGAAVLLCLVSLKRLSRWGLLRLVLN